MQTYILMKIYYSLHKLSIYRIPERFMQGFGSGPGLSRIQSSVPETKDIFKNSIEVQSPGSFFVVVKTRIRNPWVFREQKDILPMI